MQRILGQLLRSLLQNPRNFSEVAPEVRPAVHTSLLCLIAHQVVPLRTWCFSPNATKEAAASVKKKTSQPDTFVAAPLFSS